MIDRYWHGTINRISPEAPVPIVNLQETRITAGGAANVAVNIAGLGAKPYLVGITGDDEEGRLLQYLLENSNVSGEYIITVSDRRTTVKTRVVAHQQHVVRLDNESTSPISAEQEEQVWQKIEKVFDQTDIVLISDYAKGLITHGLLTRLINFCCQTRKKIIVDPKGKDYLKYKGATILTPNQREAAEACKLQDSDDDLVQKAGKTLLSEIDLEALLITQGDGGMTLFQKSGEKYHFPAISRDVYDVTGAGDTVVSTLAVSLGAGTNLKTAAELANIAAGIVVEHFGTTTINIKELQKLMKNQFSSN
jgi:rfaE bifunctional protein kinase chain/domain